MGNLKVTHLARHEYDGWFFRFSGDSETWELLKDELKQEGRAYARWTPGYQWSDGKAGAWWIDDHLLRVVYADWFTNLGEALDALHCGTSEEWIARRRAASSARRKPPVQELRRVPAHLMREYALLKVGADATLKDVRDAYRSLSKQYHPDTGGTHEGFIALQQAYEKVYRWVTVTEKIAV